MTQKMSEATFQHRVISAARLYRWRVAHFRPARTQNGWRTPMTGHKGFPDLVLARDGVVLLAELKRDGLKPSPEQYLWLAALGEHARCWTPAMWDDHIVPELRGRR